MAKARLIPELDTEDPFALAAARIVAMRGQELFDAADGVLDMSDIGRVHDMRVATRRLRAALEVFEACFPKRRYRETLKEVKRLADALGERRDRDVHILALSEFEAAVGPADRPGVRNFVSRLRSEQADANAALVPYVTQERLDALHERLDDLVAEAEALVEEPEPDGETEPEPEPAPVASAAPAQPAAPVTTNGGEPH